MHLDYSTLFTAFGGAALAAAVAIWAGFGAATILAPILAWILDLKQAIFLVASFHGFQSLVRVVAFRNAIAWRLVAHFGITAVAFSFLGSALSAAAPSTLLRTALGLFLIADAGSGLWRAAPARASGFMAGLIGTGGALRAFFLHRFLPERHAYVATSAAIGTTPWDSNRFNPCSDARATAAAPSDIVQMCERVSGRSIRITGSSCSTRRPSRLKGTCSCA